MVALLIFLKVMESIDNTGMGMGSLRVFLLFLVTIVNFVFAYFGRHNFVKFSLIFLPPVVFLIFPTLVGFVEAESFTYYPFIIIALSGVPQLLLLPERNRTIYWISFVYYFSLLLSIDFLLNHFAREDFAIVHEIDKFFPFFKASHIIIFIFINISIYYLRRINLNFESEIIKANKSLLLKNKILDNNRIKLEKNNTELNWLHQKLNVQNKQLKTTLDNLRKAQQRLVQTEKLASIGTLTAGVAHEINNPLNYITGGLALLQSELDDVFENPQVLLDSKQLEDTKVRFSNSLLMIEEGIQKASEIVNALREYSSGGNSKLQSENLEDIIDSALKFLHSKIDGQIKVLKDFQLNDQVPVFKDKLHRVILNILDNAIFALKNSISDPKEIYIKTYRENQFAIILIENTGPQIGKEIVNQIYDPFFTTKEPNEGTGLGLALSYNIIQEHEGQLDLINKPGRVGFVIKLNIDYPLGKK